MMYMNMHVYIQVLFGIIIRHLQKLGLYDFF